ncbi:MAG TPA: ATP-binding protein [Caldimonas sp.]|jgi:two-component system OmpR family sensor kinase/two-component system sensor histidine kinase QseC|nr:ATP-binding protein [Caldimonas sp.]HEX4232905.1 ATP-binding protein [Caldimonas sp.]
MNSLRLRLLVSLVGLLALAAAAMAAITYHNVLGETEALFDYQLQQMALSLRDQGEIEPAQADSLADAQLDFVIQIWTVDGRNIYASRPHASLPARALLGLATLNVDGRAWRTFGVATRERVIQVAQPVDIRQRLAAHAAWRSVLPLLVMTPLAALAIWWLAAMHLAPLDRLARDVRARDARSLAPVATGDLPDEVAPLAHALNALLARLGVSLDSQRAFVADAAHELRSPLTALKLQLELLRRAGDAESREAARSAIGEGIARASRLVEQLLALARSEPDAVLPVERVDLVAIARQAIDDSTAFADSRSVTIALMADGQRFVKGDPVALNLLVRNLADNAARYSPPGSRVEVRVRQEAGKVVLEVDDAGAGIPEDEHERVFDRFYRRAEANGSGSGLGLAIVRSVANAHGATIRLGRSALGGLQVAVSFPATP